MVSLTPTHIVVVNTIVTIEVEKSAHMTRRGTRDGFICRSGSGRPS